MPPTVPTVKIKITTRFVDEQGGQLFGPGIWDVHPSVSMRLIANGKATLVNPPAPAKGADKGDNKGEGTTKTKTPPTKPRIPPVKEPEAETGTELPEDFPSRDILVAAGFDSVEKLLAPDAKEALTALEGLTPADVTKIGLAVSK